MEDYYAILGVDSLADEVEIHAAYARKLNVFRRQMRSEARPPVEELDALREAYRVLGHEDSRRAYDQARAAAEKPVLMDLPDDQATVMVDPEPVPFDRPPVQQDFSFAGSGGEYFRIWIVNILLSIVTLGIYSAWAKVRREQYFHRNLMLDGSGFDYHGQPKAILKGRAVVFLIFTAWSASQKISPMLYGLVSLAILPLVPWLAVRAFRFRAYNTSYRGLRFSFNASYGEAFKVFVGYGLLSAITLGLAFPLFYRQLRKFVLDNLSFGSARFACAVSVGTIYRIFVLPVLLGILAVALLAFVLISSSPQGGAAKNMYLIGLAAMALPILLIVMQAVVVPYVTGRTLNAIWNSTSLDRHHFSCHLPVGGFIWLTVTNWLLMLLTLGLFIPWARVRSARYRAEHMSFLVEGDLESFVAGERTAASARGDEAAEMMDLDIAL